MTSLIYERHLNLAIASIVMISINLCFLFGGILGDPGVKESIYLHYTKKRYGGKNETQNEDIEM